MEEKPSQPNQMTDSDFTYVIPPYLLNTCVGQELYQELRWLDSDLAARNFFSPHSSHYRFRSPRDLSHDQTSFCDDAFINNLIKAKLKEKFSALGVLGASPAEDISDEYLHELFEIFKGRLMSGKAECKESSEHSFGTNDREQTVYGAINSGSVPLSSVSVEPQSQNQTSIFDHARYGEFIYKTGQKDIENCTLNSGSLSSLISWARDRKENKHLYFPYLMANHKSVFLSPLPMFWTPLSPGNYLRVLDEHFNMTSDIENGFSVLRLKLSRESRKDSENQPAKTRFYNFISNNEVKEKTGVFYYEVCVEQTATQTTNFEPLIHANDPSLSSGSSLFFNMGFTKRNIKFDRISPTSPSSSATTSSIDLKTLQADICYQNERSSDNKLDEETSTFLGAEPGVSFEGSLAISFNNSCSYASVKRSDGNFRTSSLNLNRRFSQLNRQASSEQDNSKLEIEAPFHTYPSFDSGEKRGFQTDTVGFGVNFIERSFFITLNGVMVKTINESEITSSNRYQDSIFGQEAESGPLYPIIGFRLNEYPKLPAVGNLPESRIVTNFGLKSFQFNIDGYIHNFKLGQNKLLKSVITDELTSIKETPDTAILKFERAIRGIQDDPSILNDFIGGYMVQEGFLGSLESLSSDLHDLSRNVGTNDEIANETSKPSALCESFPSTKIIQRQQLKKSIMDRQFLDAIKVMKTEFSGLEKLDFFIYELEVSHYIDLLRAFFQLKFESGNVKSSCSDEHIRSLYEQSIVLGKHLIGKSAQNSQKALKELSCVLLLNERSDIEELSQAAKIFEREAMDVKVLASMINAEILEAQNFCKESRLESMVNHVEKNVSELSSKNKNPFRLLNFESDYMDL